MKPPNQRKQPVLDRDRSEVLQRWENWLEMPMLVLNRQTCGRQSWELQAEIAALRTDIQALTQRDLDP
jgi:hypothetical protein